MEFKWMKCLFTVAVAILIAIPAVAADKGDVVVELTGKKVVKDAAGKEKFASADTAKPGDTIEYRAVYRNKGDKKVTDLLATIPAPEGMEYLPGSANPAKVSASLDGKGFSPVPLKREMTLPSGKKEKHDIPYAEYRYLRWEIKTLAPGQSVPVSIRVKMSTAPLPIEVPAKK
jgi:uncharacterized repeat protein (TIGR01451 family)